MTRECGKSLCAGPGLLFPHGVPGAWPGSFSELGVPPLPLTDTERQAQRGPEACRGSPSLTVLGSLYRFPVNEWAPCQLQKYSLGEPINPERRPATEKPK